MMTDQQKIDVFTAHIKGKTVQYRAIGANPAKWYDIDRPSWDFQASEYRVKPEPKILWKVIFRDKSVFFTEDEAAAKRTYLSWAGSTLVKLSCVEVEVA